MTRANCSESDRGVGEAWNLGGGESDQPACVSARGGVPRQRGVRKPFVVVSRYLVAPLSLVAVLLFGSLVASAQSSGAQSAGGAHVSQPAVAKPADDSGFTPNPETAQSGPASVTILWGQSKLWLTYQGVPPGAGQQGAQLTTFVPGQPGVTTGYSVQLPASGTTCLFDTDQQAPMNNVSSCQIGIPLNQGEYSGYVTVFDQNVQVFNQIASTNPGDPAPLPAPPPAAQCTGLALNPYVGLAPAYNNGTVVGYWETCADGGINAFGGAQYYGSMAGQSLNQPIIGMASTPDGGGYWLVAKDGGIFTFGDAVFYGSMGSTPLNKPVIAMAPTPNNGGYWLLASDGGIFSFGNANFYGSTGSIRLNKPVAAMAPTPSGNGYWLVASDGGIFAFGDANFYGSMGGTPLNKPVVGMVASADGSGYLLVASDGGVFAFGSAPFFGSLGGDPPSSPIIGAVTDNVTNGYWLVAQDGSVYAFNAPALQPNDLEVVQQQSSSAP